MKSIILGRCPALVNSATRFIAISNNLSMGLSASELSIAQPMPTSGTLQNFYVQVASAPGAGTKYTVTLLKNAVATAITFDIADSATSGQDTTNTVSYVAGDRITIQFTPTGTPSTPTCTWNIENVGTGHPVLTGGSGVINAATPQYASFQCANWSTSNVAIDTLIPTAGTVSNLQILGNVNVGVGNTITLTLVKNGIDTGLVASFTGTTRTGSDNVDTVSVSPGDLLYYRCDEVGAIATTRLFVGALFTPTIDGESIQTTSSITVLSTGVTQYYGVGGTNNTGAGTESLRNNWLGNSGYILRKLYAAVSVAPGTGKSYSFKIRTNQADSGVACTISDSNTTASNTTASAQAVPGAFLNVATTPSGTPTAGQPKISYVTYSAIGQFLSDSVASADTSAPMLNRPSTVVWVPGSGTGSGSYAATGAPTPVTWNPSS